MTDFCFCTFCNENFKDISELCDNIKHHLEHNKTFLDTLDKNENECWACDKTYYDSASLRQHRSLKHNHGEDHKCTECGFSTISKNVLQKHIYKHRGKPKTCNKCDQTYRTAYHFCEDIDVIEEEEEEDYECSVCFEKLSHKQSLTLHMKRLHPDRESLQCDACCYVARTKRRLAVHKKSHLKEVISCDICQQTFKTFFQLKKHSVKAHDLQY